MVSGLNIVVAGGTQAGKTTLLNTLVNAIPSGQRLITCEEVFELAPSLPDVVAMQTRGPNLEGHGQIRLRRLVKEALRMRPSRIVGVQVGARETFGGVTLRIWGRYVLGTIAHCDDVAPIRHVGAGDFTY